MKYFWTFLYLIGSFSSFSQTEITLADKAQRLTEYFSEMHIRPRAVDSTFGKHVNALLVHDLDPNKLFFTKEDSVTFSTLSQNLSSEIAQKTSTYADKLQAIFEERSAFAKKIVDELLEKPLNIDKYKELNAASSINFARNEKELIQRWEQVLIKSCIDRLSDFFDPEKPQTIKEILANQNDVIEVVKKAYHNYFEQLANSKQFYNLQYLNAIALSYDPHSNFFDQTLKEEYKDELVADRAIFGISYQRTLEGKTEITSVVPGSSAWFSGDVHVDDEIVSISATNGRKVNIDSLGMDGLRTFFTALDSDTITLTLRNDDNVSTDVQLVRSKVHSDGDIIKTAVLTGEKKIGYIALPDFYTNWTDLGGQSCANDVAKSLLTLKKSGVEGYLLDLRDNGGGSLKEAIELVGIFINYGPVVIEELSSGDLVTYKDMNRGVITNDPLIVLVNENSASASEVVAGALQDYNRALIVGQTTFGKATGQHIYPLDPAFNPTLANAQENAEWGYAKVTSLGLYRISTQSAQGRGITPDVALPTSTLSGIQFEKDLPNTIQLDSAAKKVYATLESPLPINALNEAYKPSALSLELASINTAIIKNQEALYTSLSLEQSLGLLGERHQLMVQRDTLFAGFKTSYSPISMQFNAAQLSLAPYLKKYDEQFIDRLNHDVELHEAYRIMNQLIQINQ